MARPTGTVTFLFSDIEGSTARWESVPQAMAAALARHDALLRNSIETHGGYIFKMIGDAFCAAFDTAKTALGAALDAQRALSMEDFSTIGGLNVRMALHTGTADERDGDYFGSTINRVARLLSAAHGGQVLISGSCAELLLGELPARCRLIDLGKHRLKDLAHPEHVYQLSTEGLRDAFPPLRSLDNLSNNLPAQLTSFVGRESVVAEIKSLLIQHRLVTLVGSGGAGKTRCAIQFGAELLDGSGDGVWLVELARISDASLVAGTIARALDVPEKPDCPILDSLLAYLKRKRLLLIVDNCEHVIEEARRVVAAVLHGCPDVAVLATSREALNIEGEHLFRMPSLSTPASHETLPPEQMLRYGAPLLFVDRAAAVNDRFTLTKENAPEVAEVCRRLDGIPLAIELAAARTKVLSPQELAHKLNERFRVLTGGDRSALPRHQTMRALIDWSYDLLSENERAVFRRLSVFAGTFGLESVAAVCSSLGIDEITVLDLLSSLVDKSLVQAEPMAEGTRYRLLESTRQYAREKLTEQGEYETAARAHARAFLDAAEALERAYETAPDAVWGSQVELDLENYRASLEWALIGRNDVDIGQRLAGALRWTWMFFSPGEGMKWVQLAGETINGRADDLVIAKLELANAVLSITLIQYNAAYEAALRALDRFKRLANERGIAEAGWASGRAAVFTGRNAEGDARLNDALADAERLGLWKLTCWILAAMWQNRMDMGDLDAPQALYEKALAIASGNRFDRMAAVLASMVAEYRFRRGDVAGALQLGTEALEAARAGKDQRSIINTLDNTAGYLVELRRYDEAAMRAHEALNLSRDGQAAVHFAISLQHLAAVAALRAQGEEERAAQLLGYVDMRLSALRVRREYTEQHEYDAIMRALRYTLGEDRCAALMQSGSKWTEEKAVTESFAI